MNIYPNKLKIIFLFVFVCLPHYATAAIYQSVDAQGNVVYSDQPSAHAQTVNLPQNTPPTIPTAPPPSQNAPTLLNALPTTQPNDVTVYKTLSITSPVNEQTIWDNSGNVSISVNVEPALAANDTIELMLDGQVFASSQSNASFSITGVDRGTHVLQVRIVNKDQKVVKVSNVITIYLHKAIAACNSPLTACPNGQCQKEIAYLGANPICQQNFVAKLVEVYQAYQSCRGSCARKVDIDNQYLSIKGVWIPQIQIAILNLSSKLEACRATSCSQLSQLQRRYEASQHSKQVFVAEIS